MELSNVEPSSPIQASSDQILESHPIISESEIDPKELVIEEPIGRGAFGEVFKGSWLNSTGDNFHQTFIHNY